MHHGRSLTHKLLLSGRWLLCTFKSLKQHKTCILSIGKRQEKEFWRSITWPHLVVTGFVSGSAPGTVQSSIGWPAMTEHWKVQDITRKCSTEIFHLLLFYKFYNLYCSSVSAGIHLAQRDLLHALIWCTTLFKNQGTKLRLKSWWVFWYLYFNKFMFCKIRSEILIKLFLTHFKFLLFLHIKLLSKSESSHIKD